MDDTFIGWVDIAFAAFLLLSIGLGLVRGFVFELLSLAGWVVAYLAARAGTPSVQAYLQDQGSGGGWSNWALNHAAVFGCVFVVVLIVWGLLARLVRVLVRATPLGVFDRVLGAGFGLVRGVALLLIAATVVGVSPWSSSLAWRQSQGAAWLNGLWQGLRPMLDDDASPAQSA